MSYLLRRDRSYWDKQRDKVRRRRLRRQSLCWMLAAGVISLSSPAYAADNLLTKAREEKKVVFYNTPSINETRQILEGFRKRYPYIEVESFRSQGEKLFQRITAEVSNCHPHRFDHFDILLGIAPDFHFNRLEARRHAL